MTAGAPRPLRADARRNRARVLDAARAAFATDGHEVPLDEIARRAGVGAGTVYRHFPSKEALFAAIVADNLAVQVRHARELLDGDDPAHAFEAFFCWMVARSEGNRAFMDALARAGVDLGSTEAAQAGEEFVAALGELLERSQRAGVIRRDVTVVQAKALLVGVVNARELAGGPAGTGAHLAGIVCDGLRARS